MDTLSDIIPPNIKLDFADTEPAQSTKSDDNSKILSMFKYKGLKYG